MGIFRQPQSFDCINRNLHKHSTAPVASDQTHRVDQNEIDDFLSGGCRDIMYWRPMTPSISLPLFPLAIVVSATGYEFDLY
jgi:hypothetical protein